MLIGRLAGSRPPLAALGLLLPRRFPAGHAPLHCSAQRLGGAKVAVGGIHSGTAGLKKEVLANMVRAWPPVGGSFKVYQKHLKRPFCGPTKYTLVLSGCGVYDGTEIHEASAILVHLSRGGASIQMYAPNISQMHVIDHTKGQPADRESRNVLTESARIARGKIADLGKLTSNDFDAVIFPGGFGAAKNLSTFAVDGKDCKVNGDIERVLKDFHKAGKPIGLCCISPVLAAKVLPGVEVTVGHEEEQGGKWPYAGTAGAIKALGGKHLIKEVTEAHVDTKNKVVTTPAFMCETELHHIFDGIGAMVKNVLKLTGK